LYSLNGYSLVAIYEPGVLGIKAINKVNKTLCLHELDVYLEETGDKEIIKPAI
jgi:hypothetical protein